MSGGRPRSSAVDGPAEAAGMGRSRGRGIRFGLSVRVDRRRPDALGDAVLDNVLVLFLSLSKGALLADEVGLGKTIEAGLVISQRWAERKRRVLIFGGVPACVLHASHFWHERGDEVELVLRLSVFVELAQPALRLLVEGLIGVGFLFR